MQASALSLLNPQIRPIRETDMPQLEEAAASDKHSIIRPSHVVRKDGEIVGFLSIGVLPTVLMWLHTKKTTVRDSIATITFYENLVAPAGGVIVPCPKSSPYYSLMERGGYQNAGDGSVFMKGL